MKSMIFKKTFTTLLTLILASSMFLGSTQSILAEPENPSASTEAILPTYEEVVTIENKEQFMEFVKNCQNDLYSLNKTFVLKANINLKGVSFKGIPYFSGSFNGNGFTISNLSITGSDSNMGLFRYISTLGCVYNLNVMGTIGKDSEASQLGGIAGVNYGILYNCRFNGTVTGKENVGGITGINKAGARTINCLSEAVISGAKHTGGICGSNEGSIDNCTNKSYVNTDEYQASLELNGVNLSTLNLTQNIANRYDTGGICGYSTGVIKQCSNKGRIGYEHTGYNVGGIAGSQKGTIIDCSNDGMIYGRKDVGGIVGQAQPYVESEYLKDLYQQTADQVNELDETVNSLSYSINQTSDSVTNYVNTLNSQYNQLVNSISDNLAAINNAVTIDTNSTQPYVNNIQSAMNSIRNIQFTNGGNTEAQLEELQSYITTINDNLSSLTGIVAVSEEAVFTAVDNLSSELINQSNNISGSVNGIVDSLNQGISNLTNTMNRIQNQVTEITETASNNLEYITTVDRIEDISSVDTVNLQGVLWNCTNHGSIAADLNTGGIAGCMNLEYNIDPETDLDLTNSTNVTIRTTTNCVLAHCKNYGSVTAKKNTAGAIAGLESLGLIYNCEGYGDIICTDGAYVGGIAGNSASTVEHCYSFANLTGDNHVGGIVGYGYNIKDCISISSIFCDNYCFGNIAGETDEEGAINNNLFARNEMGGIDNISYVNRAWPSDSASIFAMEGIPEGFHTITLTFMMEDSVLQEFQVPYGGSIAQDKLPVISAPKGYYAQWPTDFDYTTITENQTIQAELTKWTSSLTSDSTLIAFDGSKIIQRSDDKNYIMAVGDFYEDTRLILASSDATGAYYVDSKACCYLFEWSLESAKEKEYDTIELHIPLPEGYEDAQVYYEEEDKNRRTKWIEADHSVDGSFLVCTVPYNNYINKIGVVPVSSNMIYYIIAGVICLVVILVIVRIRIKKKKA